MTSIWKHTNRWRSALVAMVATAALAACSKGEAKKADQDNQGTHANTPSTPAKPVKPHGSHDPAHGGLVMMDATYHVEIVLDTKAGKHRVYVSDGARDVLPASTFDGVTLTVAGEELAMRRSADDSVWEATGKPAPTTGAKVAITYSKDGKPVARFTDLPIEYVLTGKMPDGTERGHEDHGAAGDHSASGEHAHAAPHGGQVKTTSGGHIELVADASGKFQVWLLDEQLAPRSATGATVKIKVAAKGYADVVAAAAGDHFEGTGAAIPGDHPAAIVTATVGGKTETARFELHLERDAAGGDPHQGH
ncbi:MAG: hypothetical protein F9K40_03885 [Kofleriaceae bacterium]|nr:MAG: hypothetical protein F9K40_03885 [Kofleriaceae bacterium]MBZ0237845.1 hypothetical protein [Kofleriaceae bacterium]